MAIYSAIIQLQSSAWWQTAFLRLVMVPFMHEPFDVYADSFNVSITAWGAKLSFRLSNPDSEAADNAERQTLGTIRMSNELLKVMVFLLKEQIVDRENEYDVQFDVPQWVLEQLGVSDEDWDEFWGYEDED